MNPLAMLLTILIISANSSAAVVHFYSNPRVIQSIFHVGLEYKDHFYEADTREGGRKIPMSQLKIKGDWQIELPDILINEEALLSQMGMPFDYKFIWGDNKTYCSELVGIALNIEPTPMTFAGTHYLKYYPDWIYRNDLGISPDQIYKFALENGKIQRSPSQHKPDMH